jgi:hypothetical protein
MREIFLLKVCRERAGSHVARVMTERREHYFTVKAIARSHTHFEFSESDNFPYARPVPLYEYNQLPLRLPTIWHDGLCLR